MIIMIMIIIIITMQPNINPCQSKPNYSPIPANPSLHLDDFDSPWLLQILREAALQLWPISLTCGTIAVGFLLQGSLILISAAHDLSRQLPSTLPPWESSPGLRPDDFEEGDLSPHHSVSQNRDEELKRGMLTIWPWHCLTLPRVTIGM